MHWTALHCGQHFLPSAFFFLSSVIYIPVLDSSCRSLFAGRSESFFLCLGGPSSHWRGRQDPDSKVNNPIEIDRSEGKKGTATPGHEPPSRNSTDKMTTKAKTHPLNGMHTAGIFSDSTIDGPEIGTLVLVVDRAKNLPNRKTIGKQDPYCAARLGKEAKKTTTDIRGGQTPKW